eukprot:CAMPEP_0113972794 /NCGR_PEP_ID=MMETSP0011_2-20120614/13800_1 /TAXON_ID=101924 /ORGANISM="Rhodosorus marinus" /LENGTH=486 /DNA_ID=CAMNT_0000990061 /DNA_START=217 /DNA_END=1677 /DNA_ORIENTATION=- /assembly_acc=CAM_ASM_000156
MQIDRRGASTTQQIDGRYAARIVSGSALSLALLVGSPALAESGMSETFRSPTQSITSTASRAGEPGLTTAESAGESTAADAWQTLKRAGEVGAEKVAPIAESAAKEAAEAWQILKRAGEAGAEKAAPIAESAAKEAIKGLQYAGEVGVTKLAPMAKSAATEAWKVVSNSVVTSAKNAGIVGEIDEDVLDFATSDPASFLGKSVSDYVRARVGLPEAKKAPPADAELDAPAKELKSSEKPEETKDLAKIAVQEGTDRTGPAAVPGAKEAEEKVAVGKERAMKVASASSNSEKGDKVGETPAGGQEIAGDAAKERKKEEGPGMVTTKVATSEQKGTVSTTDANGETPSVEKVQPRTQETGSGASAVVVEKKQAPIQVSKECTCPPRAADDVEGMTMATGVPIAEAKEQGVTEDSPDLSVKTSEVKKQMGTGETRFPSALESSVDPSEQRQEPGTETSQAPSSTASEDKKLVAPRDNQEPGPQDPEKFD